jgi:sporulation protein YlmC with PRC-barrel domain
MKKLLVGVAALLFAAPLAVSAQTTRPADKPARETARDTKAPAWKNDSGLHETKDIIGTRIKGTDGKDLGEVDQLLIDTSSGKISHVVVGLGGLAGVGEKKVVVPWSELKFAPVTPGKKNAITMDKATLDSAPRYERHARVERSPSASPSMKDSDKDGMPNKSDRAPHNPNKQ